MNNIRATQKLNEQELAACTPPSASWHTDYRHTAFIYIGGLPYNLSEGDIVTIFSQYGEPVYIKLIRDKDSGKSKGFCFLKYEDQRSCDLAVDNLGGAEVLGRILRVDHADYKVKEGESIADNTGGDEDVQDEEASEDEGPKRPMLREERELMKLEAEHDDEDPMKAFLLDEKREEVRSAVAAWEKENKSRDRRRHRHHSHRERDRDKHDRERRHRRGSPRGERRELEDRRRRRSRSRSPRQSGRHDRDGSSDRERHRHRRRCASDGSDSDRDRDRDRRHRRSRSHSEDSRRR